MTFLRRCNRRLPRQIGQVDVTDPRPNYFEPRTLERIKRLDVRARLVVEGFVAGQHKSPYHGYAVEFATHREYAPGDELRHIDWKVWSRSDRLYVKLSRSAGGAVINNEELPSLPPSVLATLGSERTAGGYSLTRSATVYEKELAPAEFVITGQRSFTVTVVNQ